MPEVQSVGTVDYQMPVQQPNQYMEEPVTDENMPMVYDPEMEKKRSASKSMLGLTLLGVAIAGGLGFWAGHSKGKKANNEFKEVAQEIYDESKKVSDKFLGGITNGKKFARNVQEKLKPYVEDAEKAADDAAKDA